MLSAIWQVNDLSKVDFFSISPLGGRYKEKVLDLESIFSEFGLMKFRVMIEIKFFLALGKINILPRKLTQTETTFLNDLMNNFNATDFEKIKSFEKKMSQIVSMWCFVTRSYKNSKIKNL